MELQTCIKESFSVIGKEGSTSDGEGFVKKLWEDANAHFPEVAPLAKRDDKGNILGIWGAMSSFARSFEPWEDNFTRGFYLAGVEVTEGAQPPEGWVKWTVPAYEYVYVLRDSPEVFSEAIGQLRERGLCLAGAVHDFICPEDGQEYMFFPIRRL